jgi:RNA polymerase sigma factor for flagellar operon FliA
MGLSTATIAEVGPKKWTSKSNIAFRSLEERNRILVEHLPQVRYIAGRIHNRLPHHVPLEDLVHSGVLGLMEALEKFDPTKNVQLKSYAKVRIRGAILDSLRELDWSPRTLRRRARQIEYANQTLRTRLGRAPVDTELAVELGISLKRFQHLLGDLYGLEVVSLQALGAEDGCGDDGSRHLADAAVEDPSSSCLRGEMNELLGHTIAELAPRKRQVLALYYFEELTMKEVGARLGVGESRVSQIHTATLLRLRARMRQLLESRARQKRAQEKAAQRAGWNRPELRINPVAASSGVASGAGRARDWSEFPANRQLQLPWPASAPPASSLGCPAAGRLAFPEPSAAVSGPTAASASGRGRGAKAPIPALTLLALKDNPPAKPPQPASWPQSRRLREGATGAALRQPDGSAGQTLVVGVRALPVVTLRTSARARTRPHLSVGARNSKLS